jgi:hypothetical protein
MDNIYLVIATHARREVRITQRHVGVHGLPVAVEELLGDTSFLAKMGRMRAARA